MLISAPIINIFDNISQVQALTITLTLAQVKKNSGPEPSEKAIVN